MISRGQSLKKSSEDIFMNNCLCNLFGDNNIWWIIIALIIVFFCCGCGC